MLTLTLEGIEHPQGEEVDSLATGAAEAERGHRLRQGAAQGTKAEALPRPLLLLLYRAIPVSVANHHKLRKDEEEKRRVSSIKTAEPTVNGGTHAIQEIPTGLDLKSYSETPISPSKLFEVVLMTCRHSTKIFNRLRNRLAWMQNYQTYATGTSAAPTYLPALQFTNKEPKGNVHEFNLIDGGVCANNSVMPQPRMTFYLRRFVSRNGKGGGSQFLRIFQC
ncbi:hypothetical protein HN51_043722 [Arachis hypogaea]|uniref:uncharacterized protein n=1 Tax=Arachis hypogaea TaxID=3818 RepID=UPI000DED6799|nr:uncharacterized protein LOC112772316 isoform X1 [Arachis hypogaea]XP_025673019.1 uncharacterized protein LOC112772316 isoform X1 [Arachis hypogaea]XP_025673020.1 uncharacterized protein LOC112772316 isoform X1 [Arachis hypogaea]XP_025673021.1 uncharacterized protein LOC112772316 isoform X1 [Arachis hypogaea]XP_025673022.1 uncharacterized protein LOC112772316 isoform X1 [Arachis hypogaea]XP_029151097.1 uncharacterized protein LOC112772316 isoform X1 [Arachis hypogaea]XP_029151098.1 uncharac